MEKIRQLRRDLWEMDVTVLLSDTDDDGTESLNLGSVPFYGEEFQNPEEIQMTRKALGNAFILISGTQRRQYLSDSLESRICRKGRKLDPNQRENQDNMLMRQDENEDGNLFGQRLADTVHFSDFLANAIDESSTQLATTRFLNALCRCNDIASSNDECGSYRAETASSRSVDVSRRAGAAILSPESDLLAMECDEIAKSGGGSHRAEDAGRGRAVVGRTRDCSEFCGMTIDGLNEARRLTHVRFPG